jgi:hypothetical protein
VNSPEDLPEGQCVCGRDLPQDCPSSWACTEMCQAAWLHHHANPDYPHPRQIREAAEARAAFARPRTAVRVQVPEGVAPGTEICVDGQSYVRVGAHWRPAGMWGPAPGDVAEPVAYQRWCPVCRCRRPSRLDGDRQVCGQCGHVWAGRPLVGTVETRGQPWPALRLRLSDGQRSIVHAFTEAEVLHMTGPLMLDRLRAAWLRMERRLCGGFADVDEPDERQRRQQQLALARGWRR